MATRRGARQDSHDLPLRHSVVQREQNRQDKRKVDGDAAEQRHGLDVNFARAGLVHHSEMQRQTPHGHRQPQRGDQRDGKSD